MVYLIRMTGNGTKKRSKSKSIKSTGTNIKNVGCGCLSLLVLLILIAVALVACSAIKGGTSTGKLTETKSSYAAPEDPEMSAELFRGVLQSAFEDEFDSADVQYEEDSNLYVIYVAIDGVTKDALAAKLSGDTSDWDTMRANIEDTSQKLHEQAQEYRLNSSISIIIMNDLNKENALLSVLDGVTVYDFMKE